MNVIQKMLRDYYEIIEYDLKPRPVVMENIEKVINCGDPSYGGAMYICTHCKNWKFVPFRCHSRFCPTCGNKYAMERTTSMSFKLVNVNHRHCVFTIDENLRDFFLNDRSLLNCLFHAVNSVISRMFFQLNKSKNFTPGFIMVLHTFGRDLKWNPHIHCLISEGGFSDDGFWRHVKYFNYNFLRNAFRTALLNEMETIIGPSFKKVKSRCYREHKQGKKKMFNSTFMQSRIFVTLRTLSNTSGVILAVLSLLHPESTTMMGILLLSITIAMRIINT